MGGMGTERLRLRDVRSAFRLIGEVRSMGEDPAAWRPHMVRRLRALFRAEVVVSSEVHVRAAPASKVGPGAKTVRVVDVGWGCDGGGEGDGGHVWRIATETDAPPGAYMLDVVGGTEAAAAGAAAGAAAADRVAVRPTRAVRGGSTFILSQYPLAHLGAVDQLGLHRGLRRARGVHRRPTTGWCGCSHVELGRAVAAGRRPPRGRPRGGPGPAAGAGRWRCCGTGAARRRSRPG